MIKYYVFKKICNKRRLHFTHSLYSYHNIPQSQRHHRRINQVQCIRFCNDLYRNRSIFIGTSVCHSIHSTKRKTSASVLNSIIVFVFLLLCVLLLFYICVFIIIQISKYVNSIFQKKTIYHLFLYF